MWSSDQHSSPCLLALRHALADNKPGSASSCHLAPLLNLKSTMKFHTFPVTKSGVRHVSRHKIWNRDPCGLLQKSFRHQHAEGITPLSRDETRHSGLCCPQAVSKTHGASAILSDTQTEHKVPAVLHDAQ